LNSIGKNEESLQALSERAMAFKDDDISHQLFVFYPSDDYLIPTCCIPPQYLCKKLIEHCKLQDDDQRKHYIHTFVSNPPLAAMAGYLMELMFHALLPLGGSSY
jgi:hypothetical protein